MFYRNLQKHVYRQKIRFQIEGLGVHNFVKSSLLSVKE
jgi:hypothetical protein